MNWEDNAAKIDGIVSAIGEKLATILGVTPDDILEEQESDEVRATRGYVACEASNVQPMGLCNYQVPLTFTIGFQVPDDGRHKRVQRMEWVFKIIEELTKNDTAPNFKLVVPNDFSVSTGGSEPHGYLWGGLTLTGSTQIVRG